MAKHFIKFNNTAEGVGIGTSINWTVSFYKEESIARFFHNGTLRLERKVEPGVLYVFNAQKGAESLTKFSAPKDPRMKVFWEYGFFAADKLQHKPVSSRYMLEAMFLTTDNEDYDDYREFKDSRLKYLESKTKKVSDKKWCHDTIYGTTILPCAEFKDVYRDGKLLITAAVYEYEQHIKNRWFWFDPERTTVEDLEEFFEGYSKKSGYWYSRFME